MPYAFLLQVLHRTSHTRTCNYHCTNPRMAQDSRSSQCFRDWYVRDSHCIVYIQCLWPGLINLLLIQKALI